MSAVASDHVDALWQLFTTGKTQSLVEQLRAVTSAGSPIADSGDFSSDCCKPTSAPGDPMTRSEILDEVDPEWRERYRGDAELAWNFYWQFARQDIERVKREHAVEPI